MRYIILIACLFLLGCTETRTEKQVETTSNNDVNLSGSVSLPIGEGGAFIPLPFSFDLKHTGSEAQNEQGKQETKAALDALGGQLGSMVVAAVKTAFPAAGAVLNQRVTESKAGSGLTPIETGTGSAAAALALWAAREMLTKRADQKRHAEDLERERVRLEGVKAQRDQAQEKALRYAEKIDPNKLNKDMDHA
jgi:hypothetical protein